MSVRSIGVVVGSNRKDSINLKLARALMKLAPSDLRCEILRIDDLPVFNQDEDQSPPEPVGRLKAQIQAVDGVLLVTPEYNRSIPTALKNALDWASRPYGQNAWAGKPVGIAGASIGAIGTAAVQQHLRSVLGYLDMPTLGHPRSTFISLKVLSTPTATSPTRGLESSSRASWTDMPRGSTGSRWSEVPDIDTGPHRQAQMMMM